MAVVTIANTDWEILDDIREALANATLDTASGEAVFARVELTTDAPESVERDYGPGADTIAVVRYVGTTQERITDGQYGCVVRAEITVAGKGTSRAARIQEALRLKNGAINAVEGSPPADLAGWSVAEGEAGTYKLTWGEPTIDAESRQPWAVAVIPLEVAFVVTSATGH